MSKMTIANCMDAALQLLNQYSIAGALVPLSYNDQNDTMLRMLNLINDAQMQIATTVKPITDYIEVATEPDATRSFMEVVMPEGFYDLEAVYLTPKRGDREMMSIDARRYKRIGDDTILLPTRPEGTYRIDYSRYPERYDSETDVGNTVLDNTPDTHEIIPYYIAAMIAVDENPKTYYAMYNVWETRLSRLGMKKPHAVPTVIDDEYNLGHFHGVW